jgi:hypothetical protein
VLFLFFIINLIEINNFRGRVRDLEDALMAHQVEVTRLPSAEKRLYALVVIGIIITGTVVTFWESSCK